MAGVKEEILYKIFPWAEVNKAIRIIPDKAVKENSVSDLVIRTACPWVIVNRKVRLYEQLKEQGKI